MVAEKDLTKDELNKLVGERLLILREKHLYTEQEMADILSISVNSYKKIERGLRSPSSFSMLKVCEHFNIPSDFVLGRVDRVQTTIEFKL